MLYSKLREKKFLITIGIIVVACIFVYWDFITFNKLYIFNDTGSDTFDSYWPFLYDLNLKIKQGEIPFWSHNMGMGINYFSTQIFIGDIFSYLFLLVGLNKLAYAFGLMAVFKILLAAIFFFRYVRYLNFSFVSSTIPTLLYAFNGYIVLWGQHYQFVNVMVFAPLVLLGFEKLLKEKKWGLFTLSIFLLAINSYYFLYVFTVFIFIYGVSRYLLVYNFKFKGFITHFSKTFVFYVLGIMAAGFMFLPTIYYVLSSPRISGSLNIKLFQLADLQYYISLIMRAFSNNSMGIANGFYGYINYYESPIIYSGVICLILIPQIFFQGSRKEKYIYGITYFLLMAMLLLPFFSLFFNAFSKVDYRWTFGIIIFNLVVLAHVLQNWIKNIYKLNMKALFIAFGGVILFSFIALKLGGNSLGWSGEQSSMASRSILTSLIFCILYMIILCLIQISRDKKNKYILISILTFLLFIEVVSVSHASVNNRMLLDPGYISGKQGYFDSTNDAIRYIQSEDPGFYRISKSYNSRFLNDALIQRFNGFKEYNSLVEPSTIQFLQKMNVTIGGNFSLVYGLDERVKLETLLNNKYYLTYNKQGPFGYEFIKEVNEVNIFRNKFALPFGYTYDRYIEANDFDKLDNMQKEDAMYKGFIIDNENQKLDVEKFNRMNINELPIISEETIIPQIKKTNSNVPSKDSSIELELNNSMTGEISVTLNMKNSNAANGKIYWKSENEEYSELKSKSFIVNNENNGSKISLGIVHNLKSLNILFLEDELTNEIDNLELKVRPIVYNKPDIDKFSANNFIATSIGNNRIKGTVLADSPKMLFFSIPYDKGWNSKVDGVKQKIVEINNGFIGIPLEKGNHTVELNYVPPMFKVGAICSLFALVIIGILRSRVYFKKVTLLITSKRDEV
ncbi:YfhO family protein [Bacillus sp. FJAT-26390]|uniref:YfhO family protein n=1 Tax=Bacillus sp. FJAT-26390 TaxID=1743142 RepID=UPI000807F3FE|nr:YfhO family protein [Bacillus sp. FJAT-26390]OBZ13449.1 hypothetical protein A7975_11495 [Bacillus sp. FJAT-26390]